MFFFPHSAERIAPQNICILNSFYMNFFRHSHHSVFVREAQSER